MDLDYGRCMRCGEETIGTECAEIVTVLGHTGVVHVACMDDEDELA